MGTCRSQRTSCTGSPPLCRVDPARRSTCAPRSRHHSANLEKLCQVLEVLRVGLQKETGLVPHEDATQPRPLTSITRPDARHDLSLKQSTIVWSTSSSAEGSPFVKKSSPWKSHRVSRLTWQARHGTALTMTQPSSANIRWTWV